MRTTQGLTFRVLAELAGMSSQTVFTAEHGKHTPGIDIIERLAAALDVSPAWLAYGLGPIESPTLRNRRHAAALAKVLEGTATQEQSREAAILLRRAYGVKPE